MSTVEDSTQDAKYCVVDGSLPSDQLEWVEFERDISQIILREYKIIFTCNNNTNCAFQLSPSPSRT